MGLCAVKQMLACIQPGALALLVGAASPAALLAQAPVGTVPAGGTAAPTTARSAFLSNPTALSPPIPQINVTGLTPPTGHGDGDLAAPYYGNPLSIAMPGGPGKSCLLTPPLLVSQPTTTTAGLGGTGNRLGGKSIARRNQFRLQSWDAAYPDFPDFVWSSPISPFRRLHFGPTFSRF